MSARLDHFNAYHGAGTLSLRTYALRTQAGIPGIFNVWINGGFEKFYTNLHYCWIFSHDPTILYIKVMKISEPDTVENFADVGYNTNRFQGNVVNSPPDHISSEKAFYI